MKKICLWAGALALALSSAAQAQSDPAMTVSGFQIEKFADIPTPLALEVPPAGTAFGNYLYVSSANIFLFQGDGGSDPILRIDPVTRQVTTFFALPAESDPIWLSFGPGVPFTNNLYVSSNNRDGGVYGDDGGSVVFLGPVPASTGEQFLTPPPPGTVLSEPGALAFGPGGAFGTDLYVANTNDPPFDIARISPSGQRSSFTGALGNVGGGIAFGPGGAFGSDLFVADFFGGRIFTLDATGTPTLFATLPPGVGPSTIAFAPPGPFGRDMYVSATSGTGSVSIYRVTPDGVASEFSAGFQGAGASGAGFKFPTPDSLAFSNDGRTLYVSDMLSNAVFRITSLQREITVDIKPGTCDNPLNVHSQGVIPVAIAGTAELDVAQIDPTTVALEGVAPAYWSLADVTVPGDCTQQAGDGQADLALKFDTQAVAAKLDPVVDGEVRTLTLTGSLKAEFGSTSVAGRDAVTIIRRK